MTENPYASIGEQGYGVMQPEPDRTSILAICSLVCSLICCIPGLSVLGLVLGIVALIGIGASQGRIGGKGLAIAGVIISLLISIAWGGLIFTVAQGTRVVSQLGGFFEAAANDDAQTARGYLGQNASGAVTDIQIIEFGDRIEADYGAFVSYPQGVFDFFGQIGESFENAASQGSQQGPPTIAEAQRLYASYPAIPGAVDFGGTSVAVVYLLDVQNQGPTPAGSPPLYNIGAQLADGTVLWLVTPPQPGTQGIAPPPSQSPPPDPAEEEPAAAQDPPAEDPDTP
ncbi:MAG: DUF4190 domain-containing protein [Planctomycetota bacterium]